MKKFSGIYHSVAGDGDIVRYSGDYAAVLNVDCITVYEVDTETNIVTDVYDRVAWPNVVFTDMNLRLNSDGTPCAVELWKEDHDGGINVCVWYHLLFDMRQSRNMTVTTVMSIQDGNLYTDDGKP